MRKGWEAAHRTQEPCPGISAPTSSTARNPAGFLRLRLTGNFGQDTYQSALVRYLRKDQGATDPGKPPGAPTAGALSMKYSANSTLVLNSSVPDTYANRAGQFFHLTPFGTAERHPYLSSGNAVHLFPQFAFARRQHNARQRGRVLHWHRQFRRLPQNLSLLFQVADGTANPLVEKPKPHIDWCYLRRNQWVEFEKTAVQDERTNS